MLVGFNAAHIIDAAGLVDEQASLYLNFVADFIIDVYNPQVLSHLVPLHVS
jgi:hypothetical protein